MAKYRGKSIVLPTVANHADIAVPEGGNVVLYILAADQVVYSKDALGIISAISAASSSGDFRADGSLAMTGDLDLDDNSVLFKGIATPANPAAGKFKAYIKPDGFLYLKNATGTEYRAGNVGDFLRDGSLAMTGDFNLDAHAIILDDIINPANPALGKFKLFLKADGDLYLKNNAGVETKLTRTGDFLKDGSIALTGEFQLGANDLLITAITTPAANPADGKFKVYMKADGKLYVKNNAGVESVVGAAGVFMADGSVPMTGNFNLDNKLALMVPLAWTPGANTPDAGKYGLFLNTADKSLWMVDESNNRWRIGFGGHVTYSTDQEFNYLAVPKYNPGVGFTTPSTEGWLVLRSDSRLRFRYQAGEEYVDGDFKANGTVAMIADLNLGAHAILVDNIDTPTELPPTGQYKFYLKSDGQLYLLSDAGVETQLTGIGGAGGGSGDFMADGSVPMTGDLDVNSQALANVFEVQFALDGDPFNGIAYLWTDFAGRLLYENTVGVYDLTSMVAPDPLQTALFAQVYS